MSGSGRKKEKTILTPVITHRAADGSKMTQPAHFACPCNEITQPAYRLLEKWRVEDKKAAACNGEKDEAGGFLPMEKRESLPEKG